MKAFITIIGCIMAANAIAQNVGIGTASPASSAMLEVSSNSKGILIPRLTTAQRNAIAAPSNGLMAYDTDTKSFWYYNGNGWVNMATPANGFNLPYDGTANSNTAPFKITNDGMGAAIHGNSTNAYGIGVQASSTGAGGWGLFANATGPTANSIFAVADSGTIIKAMNNYVDNINTAFDLLNKGKGTTLNINATNSSNSKPTIVLNSQNIGNGVEIHLNNGAQGGTGLFVENAGVGPGIYAESNGYNGVWGKTNSISAAGVIGDNQFGEAVVGRNRGTEGVGAVVGRNDSTGYGVFGFNRMNGVGVMGEAGRSGSTGIAGKFVNVNAANSNVALVATTNGAGWAANFTNTNNNGVSKGLRLETKAGAGGNALNIAKGSISTSYNGNYMSGTIVDDAVLVIKTLGSFTIPTSAPLADGTHIWVVNNAGAAINVFNTVAGAFPVANNRAQQFIYVSAVSAANWIPVQ